MLTPFQFASNSPIAMIDLDGLEGSAPTSPSQIKKDKNNNPAATTTATDNATTTTKPIQDIKELTKPTPLTIPAQGTISPSPSNLEKFLNNNQPLLTPMPLSKKRKRWRGFNQADNLTKKLAKKFNYELALGLERRHCRPQAELNEQDRLKNLKGAFYWRGESLAGKIIIIIDDVITTGATINEAAKVLKEAGASQVWAIALAKG